MECIAPSNFVRMHHPSIDVGTKKPAGYETKLNLMLRQFFSLASFSPNVNRAVSHLKFKTPHRHLRQRPNERKTNNFVNCGRRWSRGQDIFKRIFLKTYNAECRHYIPSTVSSNLRPRLLNRTSYAIL